MVKGVVRNPINVILLTLVTCGIYGIYWMYMVGKEVNAALGREAINPVLAIVSIICFPVLFYYIYLLDNALVELGTATSKPYTSNFLLWVITSLLGVGILIVIIQGQGYLNSVWETT